MRTFRLLAMTILLLVLCSCTRESLAQSLSPNNDQLAQDKLLINKLMTDLKQSSRSFMYLRSKGYKQTDKEFEEIIAKNNSIFISSRIVRRDEKGVRQIPGWPGIGLASEYKGKTSPKPSTP